MLVVGGERGLGRSLVAAFARAGADVAVAYDDARAGSHDDARAAEDDVTRAGRAGLLLPTDLTDPQRCATVVADTVEHLGGLDVLVHAVTGASAAPTLADVRPDTWHRTWSLLVGSVVHLVHAAAPHLTGGGRVLLTAEAPGATVSAVPPLDLAAAGGAVLALGHSLARSLEASGTGVVCVVPLEGTDRAEVAATYVRLAARSGTGAVDAVLAGRPVPL
ncbi:SDR family oxidoreductase [Aquipuribacter nitratireducens]|uniref:SDR family oxidoreductase n=1 Tax=Aquipuribacter nitratireducens TaxID=650104 RepID=A0ABW0GNP8_9MICO